MTFAQRRNRLTRHFSESIPVVKRRTFVCVYFRNGSRTPTQQCNKGRKFHCYGILGKDGT